MARDIAGPVAGVRAWHNIRLPQRGLLAEEGRLLGPDDVTAGRLQLRPLQAQILADGGNAGAAVKRHGDV